MANNLRQLRVAVLTEIDFDEQLVVSALEL